jgi:3-phenylpropionate/trans-cinnamate dioxygenase ferredoxin reductase subunit
VPFVWSDQYDRKIQTVGVVSGDAEVHVAHGTLEERQFVALFGKDGRIVGALGFNRARFVMQYRKLIAGRASWDEALALANK